MESVKDFISDDYLKENRRATIGDIMNAYKNAKRDYEDVSERKNHLEEEVKNGFSWEDVKEGNYRGIKGLQELLRFVSNNLRGVRKEDLESYGISNIDFDKTISQLRDDLVKEEEKTVMPAIQKEYRDKWLEYACASNRIDFEKFGKNCNFEDHFYYVEDGELICLNCGATTADYPLNDKEKAFLIYFAKGHKTYLGDIKGSYTIPQLKVIAKQVANKYGKKINPRDDSKINCALEDIKTIIKKADDRDRHIFKETNKALIGVKVFKYINNGLEMQRCKIVDTNPDSKEEDLREIRVQRCQLYMLNGATIEALKEAFTPDIVAQAYLRISGKSKEELKQLYKSVRNLSASETYKSGSYSYYTSDSEINRLVLEMSQK